MRGVACAALPDQALGAAPGWPSHQAAVASSPLRLALVPSSRVVISSGYFLWMLSIVLRQEEQPWWAWAGEPGGEHECASGGGMAGPEAAAAHWP